MTECIFPASADELQSVTELIESELTDAGFSMKSIMQVSVCVEELFINIASYAYPDGGGDVTVSIDISEDTASIRFTDSGIAFDPLSRSDPDITLPAEERDIGGLGIFMVRKMMDDVVYSRTDGKNIITIIKHK